MKTLGTDGLMRHSKAALPLDVVGLLFKIEVELSESLVRFPASRLPDICADSFKDTFRSADSVPTCGTLPKKLWMLLPTGKYRDHLGFGNFHPTPLG